MDGAAKRGPRIIPAAILIERRGLFENDREDEADEEGCGDNIILEHVVLPGTAGRWLPSEAVVMIDRTDEDPCACDDDNEEVYTT